MKDKSARQEVTVGIPIYKNAASDLELFSFIRCCKILGSHPFTIITFDELDVKLYTHILKDYNVS